MPARARTIGERVYSLLLFAYPADFRREYGGEMARAFSAQYRMARGAGRARVWLDTIADLFPTAFQEHTGMTLTDLAHAARRLRSYPVAAALAAVSLSLGIGANTMMFSLIHRTIMRDLPYKDADRLVEFWSINPKQPDRYGPFASADFLDIREQSTSFQSMALFTSRTPRTYSGSGYAEKVFAESVTPGMFEMFGVAPVAGRPLREEDASGAERGIMLSHEFWTRKFGADPAVIGKPMTLDGEAWVVAGVMPPGFHVSSNPGSVDAWTTINLKSPNWIGRKVRWMLAGARLKPGVSIGQARAEVASIAARISAAHPDTNKDWAVAVEASGFVMGRDAARSLYPMLGAVVFVLVIACANVSNLLISRAAARRGEISLRAALGASRGRLIRELIADGIILALPASLMGVAIAFGGLRFVLWFMPSLAALDIGLDLPVLAFTLAVGLAAGILAALAPAWFASRIDLNESLKEGGRGALGARSRLRDSLVVTQVAFAMTLLAGAGLMISSVAKLRGLDLGFNPDNLFLADLGLTGKRYATIAPKREIDMRRVEPAVEEYFAQVLDRATRIPGVEAAVLSAGIPVMRQPNGRRFSIAGRPALPMGERPEAYINMVMGDFPGVYRIPMRRGAFLDPAAPMSAEWTCVVNESFAKKHFPDQDPVSQFLTVNAVEEERPRRIVGVIADTWGGSRGPQPEIFTSYLQQPREYPGDGQRSRFRPALAIRTSLPASAIVETLRKQIAAIDPALPIDAPRTFRQSMDDQTLLARFIMSLLTAFAFLALLLSAMGIYAVMSHSVAGRLHEIGIRMALGASGRDTLRMVLRHGLGLCAIGVLLGLAASAGLSRAMRGLLFGVEPTDPLTYAAVVVVLSATAMFACAAPALRATRVDPSMALRQD